MKDVYLGFAYDDSSWISRVIARFQGFASQGSKNDPLSHVFFLYRDDLFGWVVLGSEARGFYPMPAENWPASYVKHLFLVPELGAALASNRGSLGLPYDYPGLLGMAYVEAMRHFFHRSFSNPLARKGAWFCSAIAAQVFNTAKEGVLGDPTRIDPERMLDTMREYHYQEYSYSAVIAPIHTSFQAG
jgi:hypothetical protein